MIPEKSHNCLSSGPVLPSLSCSSSLQRDAWPRSFAALEPSEHSFPLHPSVRLRLLPSRTRTQTADPQLRLPPSSPVIHLLPAVFHAEEDSCLNVYVKSYFLFLKPWSICRMNFVACVKIQTDDCLRKKNLTPLLCSPPWAKETAYKGEIKGSILL